MPLSVRKKRYLTRLGGYAIHPVVRRARRLVGREQTHLVGGHPLTLPPEHDLPFYQRRDPTYDTYAIEVLENVAASGGRTLVIDLGANVGDTAVAALSASPEIDVVAVEGDPRFVGYLRRNLEDFGSRATIVDAFVGPVGQATTFVRHGSTGGFGAGAADASYDVTSWVSPDELLAHAEGHDRVVWKSDIDGLDIHLLVECWSVIDGRCDVLWFEYDPVATLGDRDDVERLVDLLAGSGRWLRVYDNLGRAMVDLAPGPATASGLRQLTAWLFAQRNGHVTVPYVDVWAFRLAPEQHAQVRS
jgi:FkbM family methyltransferase